MNLKGLAKLFKETAWMINPFYKFLVAAVFVGGPLMALYVFVLAYTTANTTIWITAIILLSMVIGFKLGPSPFFIVNCSWIYFRFDKFGIWLPLVSYLIALTILGLQWAADKTLTPSNE